MSLVDKYKDGSGTFVDFIDDQFDVKEFDKLICTEFTDKFVIEFKPTDKCNFGCSYCCFHDNQGVHLSDENFYKYLEVLRNINTSNKEIFLFVYGGEPTLHPHMTEYIIRMRDNFPNKKFRALIQSNGMHWSLEDYKHHCEILMEHDIDFQFGFSFHHESCKVSDLKPRIDYLRSIDKFETLVYMLTRKGIDKHVQMIKVLKGMGIPLYVRTILQESEWIGKSEYRKWISHKPDETPFIVVDDGGVHCYSFEELAMQGYLNFNGYCCSAGQNVLLLSANGKIYRCDMDFLYDKNVIYDVNISTEQLFNINECLQCTHKFCSIYYGDKWNEKTANLSHEESESS